MLFSRNRTPFYALILLIFLLTCAIQPVQADRVGQTVPTRGPSRTPTSSGGGGDAPTAKPPTAILATSPVSGVQPTATTTATFTATLDLTASVGVTAETPTAPVDTATPVPQATDTAVPATTQASELKPATELPTLPAVPASDAQAGQSSAVCFSVGLLVLVVVVFLIVRRARRSS